MLTQMLYSIDKAMADASTKAFPECATVAALEDRQDCGIEVLAFGNNNYSLIGLRKNGVLKNAIADAIAVAGALKKLGARVKIVEDVKDVLNMETVLDDWVESRLATDMDNKVRIVLIFWAGHAFSKDGVTHLIPTGDNWPIKRIRPGRETLSVQDIIKAVRSKCTESKLIVCLDSCRTQVEGTDWKPIERLVQGGPDTGQYNGVEVWFSTAHGLEAADGPADHSHFTYSILHCLGGNLQNKTFEVIWGEISQEMEKRDPKQLSSRYENGSSKYKTLLPPVDLQVAQPKADSVSVHIHTSCVNVHELPSASM
jgi:hypothetical protein